jgi:YbbR domain-containing protein
MLRLKSARAATVTVQIAPAPLERTFRNRPVHLRQVAPNLTAKADPSAVDVTLRGTREELASIEPDGVLVYVDVGGLGAGKYQLNLHGNPVGDAGVTRIEPSTAQVWIASVK